jgi:hypothetical protein
VQPPAGWIAPVFDGRETSYFELLGAGSFEPARTGGAMHQIDAAPPVVSSIRFGFTRQLELCIRLDGPVPMAEQLAGGYEFTLNLLEPVSRQITARFNGSDNGCYVNYAGARAAAAASLELAVPLDNLNPGSLVAFTVIVTHAMNSANAAGPADTVSAPATSVVIQRLPERQPIDLKVPGGNFDGVHWRA